MADELSNVQTSKKVKSLKYDYIHSPEDIRILVLNGVEPFKLSNALVDWPCCAWTPEFLANEMTDYKTSFRICAKKNSTFYQFDEYKVVMESDCLYAKASLTNYYAWLSGDLKNSGELAKYPRDQYWCYADYKYMVEMFKDFPALKNAPKWESLGFPEITGDQTTIWIGSEGSSTPCHLDTYGCNLVAQLYGRKKWCLFSPSETKKLYPTRIPYEESSVFSHVNVKNPDLSKTPHFETAIKYEVILCPGDVLFVPKHWWHYVESLEPSISINTWIALDSDNTDRVREAITKLLVFSMKSSEGEHSREWLNPTEKFGSYEETLEQVRQSVNMAAVQEDVNGKVKDTSLSITHNDIIDCVTSPSIISEIANKLLERVRSGGSIKENTSTHRLRDKEISLQENAAAIKRIFDSNASVLGENSPEVLAKKKRTTVSEND